MYINTSLLIFFPTRVAKIRLFVSAFFSKAFRYEINRVFVVRHVMLNE